MRRSRAAAGFRHERAARSPDSYSIILPCQEALRKQPRRRVESPDLRRFAHRSASSLTLYGQIASRADLGETRPTPCSVRQAQPDLPDVFKAQMAAMIEVVPLVGNERDSRRLRR